jgi:hypothetical protein
MSSADVGCRRQTGSVPQLGFLAIGQAQLYVQQIKAAPGCKPLQAQTACGWPSPV